MRKRYLLISSLTLLAFLLAACGGQATPPANVAGAVNTAVPAANTLAASTAAATAAGAVSTLAASTAVQTAAVQDLNSLMAALQAAGVTVGSAGAVSQPLFNVPGQSLTVNGQEVQAYVFDTPQAMEAAAAEVAADGSTIGTTTPTWTSDPHFYKADRLLVVYVGQDQKIMDILSNAFGAQFAGR
jgi:hypothetical protein